MNAARKILKRMQVVLRAAVRFLMQRHQAGCRRKASEDSPAARQTSKYVRLPWRTTTETGVQSKARTEEDVGRGMANRIFIPLGPRYIVYMKSDENLDTKLDEKLDRA